MRCPRVPTIGLSVVLIAAVATLAPVRAAAVERGGIFVGTEIGMGWITCNECKTRTGLAAGFHAGWMLSDRFALVLDGASILHPAGADGDLTQLTSAIGGIGARYFAGERVWVQAVLGKGSLDTPLSGAFGQWDDAVALMGAAGFEIVQKRIFVLDLSARIGTFRPEDGRVINFSLALGLNLY